MTQATEARCSSCGFVLEFPLHEHTQDVMYAALDAANANIALAKHRVEERNMESFRELVIEAKDLIQTAYMEFINEKHECGEIDEARRAQNPDQARFGGE